MNLFSFALLWLVTFAIYVPAAKAGWVIDTAGWLYYIRHQAFWDYINRPQSHIASLYQFTQAVTYLFYKLWGVNVWAWSLLFITLHATVCQLLFVVFRKLFTDSGIKNGPGIALCGVLLYAVCPQNSEVLIWEAAYHYLQGFLMILLIMFWVQKYLYSGQKKYAAASGVVFLLSSFSLEVFYMTPVFVLTLALYYRIVIGCDKRIFKQVVLFFLIPQAIIYGGYSVMFHLVYGNARAHLPGSFIQSPAEYLSKPLKYLFHIVFLGRYFHVPVKDKVYAACESLKVLIPFYGLLAATLFYAAARFKKIDNYSKIMLLLLVWCVLTISLLIPLPFPGSALLVFYDRYSYFAGIFVYLLLVMIVNRIAGRYIAILLLCIYACLNLFFTIKVNTYWKHSAYVNNRLLRNLPAAGDKTIILLNIPENMNGVPMIGASPEGQYKWMRELFVDSTVHNKIFDAVSYNMVADDDGVNVAVINDSTLHVTFNQWGNWWWYDGHGAGSYQNNEYRLDIGDGGHWYSLILKKPASQYLLLYSVGANWKAVDMSKKNEAQY